MTNIIEDRVVPVTINNEPHEVTLGIPSPIKLNSVRRKASNTKVTETGIEKEFDEVTFEEELIKIFVKNCSFPFSLDKIDLLDYQKIVDEVSAMMIELEELKKKLGSSSGQGTVSGMNGLQPPSTTTNSPKNLI